MDASAAYVLSSTTTGTSIPSGAVGTIVLKAYDNVENRRDVPLKDVRYVHQQHHIVLVVCQVTRFAEVSWDLRVSRGALGRIHAV